MKRSHEDVFIYLDLTKELLKKKDIIKAINYFISEKNKTNINGHYGLLIFQEEGNPIFLTNKKDSDIILKVVDENWKLRPKKKSFFENGLFYIFSYIAETVRKKSKTYRIIVITDTPSDLSEDYTEALFNLVAKIKVFPTFIDIVRVSEKEKRFFKDDVKLNILASDTKGSIFYIQDKAEFKRVINNIAQSVQPVDTDKDDTEKMKLTRSDYEFYSQLAKNLEDPIETSTNLKCYFCSEYTCPVCKNGYDVLKICPDCSSAFHNCGLIKYAIQNNIGIPHIFRCPKCDVLLKINQDAIVIPEDTSIDSAEEYIRQEEKVVEPSENKLHFNPLPKVKELRIPSTEELPNLETKSRTVRIGGYFGKLYTVKKMGDKIIYKKIEPTQKETQTSKLNDVIKDDFITTQGENKYKILICPECGTKFSSDPIKRSKENICPFCSHKLN